MHLTYLERVTRMISPGPDTAPGRHLLSPHYPNISIGTGLTELTMEEPLLRLLLASFWRCNFTRWSMSSSSSSSSWNNKYRFRINKNKKKFKDKYPSFSRSHNCLPPRCHVYMYVRIPIFMFPAPHLGFQTIFQPNFSNIKE